MAPAWRIVLSRRPLLLGLLALVLVLVAAVRLEQGRQGLVLTGFSVGTTPATLIAQEGRAAGPVVVVAHGFAGSRQIMQAYSLHLAQAGFRVVTFDFEGHGRNPVPMSGDVTAVDGTTALLVAETRRVIAAARALPDVTGVALLGHSMATDILVRASIEEAAAGSPVAAIVAISMFSQAVTADTPPRLLVISGQGEARLRDVALKAVRLVDPAAGEGDLAVAGPVQRKAVVAPLVEHVGVLFSPTAVQAARDWLEGAFTPLPGPASAPAAGAPGQMGLWILALLAGIVLAFRPIAALLPPAPVPDAPVPDAPPIPPRRFLAAILLPALAVPLVLPPLYAGFLPVLVADYLMLHLAAFGILQLAILRHRPALPGRAALLGMAAVAVWGLAVFGAALDRHAAAFWPTAERLPIIAILALGTLPFMLADAQVTGAGRGALWRRISARVAVFASLILAAVMDPDRLLFVVVVLPVFLLFYLVHGLMGRWVARRSGAMAAGLGLGLCLAWALGVSFPLFRP